MKESIRLKIKSIILPVLTIRKNFKRDSLNCLEVLESSRLEELLRLRLERSRIEYKMLSALLRLPLKKVSLLVEDALCFMLAELLTP